MSFGSRGLPICLVVATACGGGSGHAGSYPTAAGPIPLGVYHILERVPQTNPPVTIEGKLTLLRDTILVDVTRGPCRSLESSPSAWLAQCGDVRLWFDRRDPVQRNSYSVRTTMTVSRRKCASYTNDANGRSVCARYEIETEDQIVTRTGILRPQRQ